jgi:hypothetical protein
MSVVHGLREAMQRLDQMDIERTLSDSLEAASQVLQAKVVDLLSRKPGDDHAAPWLRTGGLRASIGHSVDGMTQSIRNWGRTPFRLGRS